MLETYRLTHLLSHYHSHPDLLKLYERCQMSIQAFRSSALLPSYILGKVHCHHMTISSPVTFCAFRVQQKISLLFFVILQDQIISNT